MLQDDLIRQVTTYPMPIDDRDEWLAAAGTRLSVGARTRWPRGMRPIGRVVEAVVLSPREAESELANREALIERELTPGSRPVVTTTR